MSAITVVREKLESLKKKLSRPKSHNEYILMKDDDEKAPSLKGKFMMYVGENRKKYWVPRKYLLSPTFVAFLHKYEDELINRVPGPFAIPCSTETFDSVLKFEKAKKKTG